MQINKQLIWVGVISFAAVQIGRTPLPLRKTNVGKKSKVQNSKVVAGLSTYGLRLISLAQ
jgi:hypothetical protein